MRTSLAFSLLEAVGVNIAKKNAKGIFFELGNVYANKKDDEGLPMQNEKVAITAYGGYDYYDIKGIIESLFEQIGAASAEYKRSERTYLHQGISADLRIGERGWDISDRLIRKSHKNSGSMRMCLSRK